MIPMRDQLRQRLDADDEQNRPFDRAHNEP